MEITYFMGHETPLIVFQHPHCIEGYQMNWWHLNHQLMFIQLKNSTSNPAVSTPLSVSLNKVLRSGVAYENKVLPTNLISSARGFMLPVDGTADWVIQEQ